MRKDTIKEAIIGILIGIVCAACGPQVTEQVKPHPPSPYEEKTMGKLEQMYELCLIQLQTRIDNYESADQIRFAANGVFTDIEMELNKLSGITISPEIKGRIIDLHQSLRRARRALEKLE